MKKKCFSIAIEGSDGAGKATTTKLLMDYLKGLGYKVATIDFPRYGKGVAGKILYEVLKGEKSSAYGFLDLDPKIASVLYAMDRAEAKQEIEQMMEENDYLIFDRYVSSSFIHQGGKISADEERAELIQFLSRLEYEDFGLPRPDTTYFLYLPAEIAQENKRIQNGILDAVEQNLQYLKNSNKAGLWATQYLAWNLISCVNGEGHQKDRGEVFREVLKSLKL